MNRRAVLLVPALLLVMVVISAVAWGPADAWRWVSPTATYATPLSSFISPTSVDVVTEVVDTETATTLPSPTEMPSPTPTGTSPALASPLDTPTSPVSPLETPIPSISPLETPEPPISPLPTPTYPPPPTELRVPILMYHYVSVLPSNADSLRQGLTVEPDKFEAQLQYMIDQGYETVRLVDLYDALSLGKPLPEKSIVLTFDDGYKDAYTDVLPILQKYGFVGEFFVLSTPPHFEAPNYMTWGDMAAMAEAGMSIQGHGRDHYDLRNRSYDFLVYQILGIKQAVEAHTERPVTFFCYPSGKYDRAVLGVVESAGYLGAVTTEWGATQRLDNRYTWPRIRVHGRWSMEKFIDVLTRLEP